VQKIKLTKKKDKTVQPRIRVAELGTENKDMNKPDTTMNVQNSTRSEGMVSVKLPQTQKLSSMCVH
jgi:hypothetical protein